MWFTSLVCIILSGCSTGTKHFLSAPGIYPGTQVKMYLSMETVEQGESSSVVFEMHNTTNTAVKVPVDEWGYYKVQSNQVDSIYGLGFDKPDWYYKELEPGQVLSHTYTIHTKEPPPDKVVEEGFVLMGRDPMALYLSERGVHQIRISRVCPTQNVGVLNLEIKQRRTAQQAAAQVQSEGAPSD